MRPVTRISPWCRRARRYRLRRKRLVTPTPECPPAGGTPDPTARRVRMGTTVEVMVAAFRAAGTPFLIGHPGGESVELLEAARQGGVRFLFAKQESAGAMIAATWGDLTGAPGVCLSTRAPGA